MMSRLTFGEFTFLLSLVFLLIQVVLLQKEFPRFQYLQVLVGLVFGFFVDFGMLLTSSLCPKSYFEKSMVLLFGSAVLALGVYLQVVANVIINPGEGAVRTIARKMAVRFGSVKVIFDLTLLILAGVLSLLTFKSIKGIREGTIASAILVGSFASAYAYIAKHISLTNKCLEYLADVEERPSSDQVVLHS